MRKVKVLAFVLAALMVVAAFAGCGTKQLKTDVSTLDERVTALETLLKQVSETVNGGATKDDITEILDAITANKAEAAAGDKALADAIAKITADQATANATLKSELQALVDAAKKDQTAGDATLQAALKDITNSLNNTTKDFEDAIEDLLDEVKKGDDAAAKDLAAAIEAINKAQAEQTAASNKALTDAIEALKAADKAASDSLTAALKEISDAQTAQNAAFTAALEEAMKTLREEQVEGDDELDAKIDALIESLNKSFADLNDKLDKLDKDTSAQTSLEALRETYIDRLESKEAELAVNKNDYTDEDINKLTTLISDAKTSIRAAADADKVTEAYNKADAEISKILPMDVQLANAIYAFLGKVKHDTSFTNLDTLYTKVVAHYTAKEGSLTPSLTSYGTDKLHLKNDYAAVKAAKTAANTIKTTTAADINTKINAVKTTDKGVVYGKNEAVIAAEYNKYVALFDDIEANKWFDQSAVKGYLTVKDLLVGYKARLSQLVEAAAAYEILGGYDDTYVNTVSVFKPYNDLATAGTTLLYTSKSAYDSVAAKLNSWMAAYQLDYTQTADKTSVKNIIGTDADYDGFLANKKKVDALNVKYNEFVANIVSRVLAFEKLTVINDANIREKIAIDKAVKDWELVWAADTANNIPKFEVSPANYAEMIKNGFEDTRTTLFIYNDTVRSFYTTTYQKAVDYADKINERIKGYKDGLAAGTNYNDVVGLKKLWGYVGTTASGKTTYQEHDKKTAEMTTDPTIKSFYDIYKTNSYDLSSLINRADYDAVLAAVDARIKSYKATAAEVAKQYKAINDKMAADRVTAVNLNYEDSINSVYALYASMTGFNAEMADWANVSGSTTKFEVTPLMVKATYEGVYSLKSDINRLRDAADKLVAYYDTLSDVFVHTQVKATDDVTKVPAFIDAYTTGSGTSEKYFYSYVKNVAFDNATGKYVYDVPADEEGTATEPANVMTVAAAAEVAETIYQWFMAQNGNKKYQAVEDAKAVAFEAQKLLVVKSYAVKAVLNAAEGSTYDKSYGFDVCQATAVTKILAVDSIKAVADELHHFVVEAGATLADTANSGVYISSITFGAKNNASIVVIDVNGNGELIAQ